LRELRVAGAPGKIKIPKIISRFPTDQRGFAVERCAPDITPAHHRTLSGEAHKNRRPE
jgi:hypothetical protein